MPLQFRWLLALALLSANAAHAGVTLNLKDADINTLITTVSEVTGKNFIVDTRVKGKVTVISSSPMDAASVYETFLAVLEVNGFAAVPAGKAIKILPDTNARMDGGGPISSGGGLPLGDVVTHVYQIQNISAAQLVPILRPLVPQWGHLAAYTPSNMLIITDRAGNVQRLEKIIGQMDQTGDRSLELVKLQHAAASEVVRILTTLVQADKAADASSKPASVIADERSNSILVGGDKSERQKIIGIIAQLDSPLTEDGATQVVYLRYANAENLAPILEGYAQQSEGTGKTAAAPTGGSADGRTRILADKDTNALVITSNPKTMRAVRNVIAQLDIKRAQVLVEAIIAEVSAQKASQLGVDWAVYNPNSIAAAGINNAGTAAAIGAVAASGNAGAAVGIIGSGLTLGGGKISNDGKSGTSFFGILKALQGDGDTNILSTPSIVATDNEESKITVGQEVPFLSGSFSNTGGNNNGAVNPFQTIERKDVGLTLGLTPQINEGNNVQLKINLESSSVSSAAGTVGTAALVTNKRTVTTTVSVESNQVLVLGGLIDDQITDTESGIPLLSSIPVLGWLFQSRSISKTKRNLMVFIRPAILRSKGDADFYTRRKYDAVRDAQVRAGEDVKPTPLPNPQPLLPEFNFLEADQAPRIAPPLAPEPTLEPIPESPEVLPPLAPPSETFEPAPAPPQ